VVSSSGASGFSTVPFWLDLIFIGGAQVFPGSIWFDLLGGQRETIGYLPPRTANLELERTSWWWKDLSAGDGPAAYQLVGGVVAYQGDDG